MTLDEAIREAQADREVAGFSLEFAWDRARNDIIWSATVTGVTEGEEWWGEGFDKDPAEALQRARLTEREE